jgi:ElaB/YqjD/DUF883 family membrane-anchored ribosome-binding protein
MSAKREQQNSTPGQPVEESIVGSQGGEGWGQSAGNAGMAKPMDEGTQEQESAARKTILGAVDNAAEAIASSTADAGEALGRATRAAREGAAEVARDAYTVGTEATHVAERHMRERPWMTFFAGALLGGVIGSMLASRR